jgi:hypothetical protein
VWSKLVRTVFCFAQKACVEKIYWSECVFE